MADRGLRGFALVAFGALVVLGLNSAMDSVRRQLVDRTFEPELSRLILLAAFVFATALFGAVEYLILLTAKRGGRYLAVDVGAAISTGLLFSFFGGVLEHRVLREWASLLILLVTSIWTLSIWLRLRGNADPIRTQQARRASFIFGATAVGLALFIIHMILGPNDLRFAVLFLVMLVVGGVGAVRAFWAWQPRAGTSGRGPEVAVAADRRPG